MLRVEDNRIWRGAEKIGWVEAEWVFDHTGRKIGYFSGNYIYRVDGMKIGYIQDGCIRTEDGRKSIRLEDNRAHVAGGTLSDAARAAVRLLLGD